MQALILGVFLTAALAAVEGQQTFTGMVTDDECANGDHSQMRMGSSDAECTVACIFSHGAKYVLYDGNEAYTLSDQQAVEEFAGRRVRVTGRLDAASRTIQMDSIAVAE
jgi:hypothetical protein